MLTSKVWKFTHALPRIEIRKALDPNDWTLNLFDLKSSSSSDVHVCPKKMETAICTFVRLHWAAELPLLGACCKRDDQSKRERTLLPLPDTFLWCDLKIVIQTADETSWMSCLHGDTLTLLVCTPADALPLVLSGNVQVRLTTNKLFALSVTRI